MAEVGKAPAVSLALCGALPSTYSRVHAAITAHDIAVPGSENSMMIPKDWIVAGLCGLALAGGLATGGSPARAASAAFLSTDRETVVRGLEAQFAAVLIKERKLADDRETRLLGAAEERLIKARAELSTLKRDTVAELGAARAEYARLAAGIVQRDAAAQTEIEAYRAEAEQRVAQATPEELAALQQFADGDRVVAEPVLMSIREARKRATLKAAEMRIAQDERATADEHNIMREHGEATTLEVLKLYDIAAADDPADSKTNLMRGWLSQQERLRQGRDGLPAGRRWRPRRSRAGSRLQGSGRSSAHAGEFRRRREDPAARARSLPELRRRGAEVGGGGERSG